MKLIFERSREGHKTEYLPTCDTPSYALSERRASAPRLPRLNEPEVSRHYSELAGQVHGLNKGFYPLGSCTMKYTPKLCEQAARLPGFRDVHPLQPANTVRGCVDVLRTTEAYLCEITGMDAMTFQPCAGAHGEFTGLLLIKKYHDLRGDKVRTKIIVPDSAHGTNPASAAMNGYEVVSIPSNADGCVDLDALRAAVGPDTAGLMLTNPNTVGLFDPNILEITKIIHDAGGLCYYDGANSNAIIGVVRPGDMGFDCIHLNLHKTFATPHGGGGPGSGPVGCKAFLREYLPVPQIGADGLSREHPESVGQVGGFSGNFAVVVKALAYLRMLGREGVPEVAENAVLCANYMMHRLKGAYDVAYDHVCMHEFVLTLERQKHESGVTAMDIAKGLIDRGIHPPTMYFPLIVHEALMIEPTETENKQTLDEACDIFLDVLRESAEVLHTAPHRAPISRPDEVTAARNPIIRFSF